MYVIIIFTYLSTVALPGPPVNASVSALNCSSLIVAWEPPNNAGGVGIHIASYELVVTLNDSIIKELSNITDTSIVLTDLDYETEYDISIIATNCMGRGEAAFITSNITIGKYMPVYRSSSFYLF